MIHHLTTRVAWHDRRWDGTICDAPSKNSYCIALERVRQQRDDALEDTLAGTSWSDLPHERQPPCVAESAGFMNERSWLRRFEHPYRTGKSTRETHGGLEAWDYQVPPFATFAVPFWWMLRGNQAAIDEMVREPLPEDYEAPFPNSWVFNPRRQLALTNHFFNQIVPGRSLVVFYTKDGQPLNDSIRRLVVGIGTIDTLQGVKFHPGTPAHTHPLWDRVIEHSIRPDGAEGFLLPYHDYLEPTGDPEEDRRRRERLLDLAVTVDSGDVGQFSYFSELAAADVILPVLIRSLSAIRLIRDHQIAKGPWLERENWLNDQIAAAWQDRGAFPGLGSILEAIGVRLGTALALDLFASGVVQRDEDPWPVVDALFRGFKQPPHRAYVDDLEQARRNWTRVDDRRRSLAQLLSRFAISPGQAWRWFHPEERAGATRYQCSDDELLQNPYRIIEADLGSEEDLPIHIGIVDRGMLPDTSVARQHPVPEPSRVGSPNDWRRIRAAVVSVLQSAASKGDSLLSFTEALERVRKLNMTPAFDVSVDWLNANQDELSKVIEFHSLYPDPSKDERIDALQLKDLVESEVYLKKMLEARAARSVPSLGADWEILLIAAINARKNVFDPHTPRHARAMAEQRVALETVTTRRLGVLVGRAGTGKTSVLGALMQEPKLRQGGILLLAPTGKARVRLAKAADAEAMTVAQFLYPLGRYDGARQRPLFEGERHRKQKTVIVDECSMLTMDDLRAVLQALDLAHVERLILVGDPNQLPPIGVGRPFSDLTAFLEKRAGSADPQLRAVSGALAKLTVEVRTAQQGPSDTLRLASWFTREAPTVDADRILSDLELGGSFNDLDIVLWRSPDELRARMLEKFGEHLKIKGLNDREGFNRALGIEADEVNLDNSEAVEDFQILSPVRMHPHGVHDLNRWIQRTFRAEELRDVQKRRKPGFSDESITRLDKVIQTRNESRRARRGDGETEKFGLANGEIGVVARASSFKGEYIAVLFSGRDGLTFPYRSYDFKGGRGPLELAYALTVHKAQGSEFSKVFLVLPRLTGFISRELLYTALTRARKQLVLFIEGDDPTVLYELTKPERSETGRRNTNLFQLVLRKEMDEVPYAENLIHRTLKGHMVRSKSELAIANVLHDMKLDYQYERPLELDNGTRRLRPDFSFESPAGDVIVWEHLGMLDVTEYREGWEWKKARYVENGYVEGETLFWTEERGGLDSEAIRQTALKVKDLL